MFDLNDLFIVLLAHTMNTTLAAAVIPAQSKVFLFEKVNLFLLEF